MTNLGVDTLGPVGEAIVGYFRLGALLGLPVLVTLLVTRRAGPRSFVVAAVLSPLCTLLLGVLLVVCRFGVGVQQGAYLEVFTSTFLSVALLGFFLLWWFLAFRWFSHKQSGRSAGQ